MHYISHNKQSRRYQGLQDKKNQNAYLATCIKCTESEYSIWHTSQSKRALILENKYPKGRDLNNKAKYSVNSKSKMWLCFSKGL